MNIGFDLDKIFIDYPPIVPDKIIDRLYKQKTNGKLLYRIPSKTEQVIRILSHHPWLRPPILKNIKFVKNLAAKKTNKHFLISSRFGFLKGRTEEIIKKYHFENIFDGMFFNFKNRQPHIFKNDVLRKLKIEYYIDDDFPLIKFLAEKNPKTKFFWLNPEKSQKLEKNLFAIKELTEIFK